MSFWDALAGRRQVPAVPRPILCSFCGAAQAQVAQLVQGPGELYICDRCVHLCRDVLEGGAGARPDPIARASEMLLRELASLPRPIALATSRRFVEAAVALAEGDRAALLGIARTAGDVGDVRSAALVMARIPEPTRTELDRMEEAIYLDWAGEGELARAAIERIDPAALDELGRTVLPLHRAAIALAAGERDRDQSRALEDVADAADRALAAHELDPRYRRSLAREVLLVRARASRARGELARAEALLREHLLTNDGDAQAWALLHDVHDDRGEREHARAARLRALEHAHPESALAIRLAERERGPFR